MLSIKVLFLSAASSLHTNRWVNALASRGIDIHLAYCKNHKPNGKYAQNITLHPLPFPAPWGYYANMPYLKSIFRKEKCDLLNTHYASGYGSLAYLSRIKPNLLSVWGSDVYNFPYKSKRNMALIRRNLLSATSIASTSHAMAKQVYSICPNWHNTIEITPFGVDTEKFHNKDPEKERNHVVIGTVKGLEHKYGIDTLLKVFASVMPKTIKPIELKIYGNGPDLDELKALSNTLGIDKKVSWEGTIPNQLVPDALWDMDIFCCFSREESFGVAVIEAMAAGVPVIATRAEGLQEVLNDGENGILCPIDDDEELSKKLLILIDNPELRKKMSQKALLHVKALYEWEDNVSKMVQLYHKTICNFMKG